MEPQPSIEKEIIRLEHAYWKAIQERDLDAALRLTDDTCIVTGAQGFASIDRKMFAKMLGNEQWTLHKYEIIGEPVVKLVNAESAVVAYKVREEMTVDGKPLTLEAADSSAWVRKDGRWRCVLHTESLLGDSFGRDRVASIPSA